MEKAKFDARNGMLCWNPGTDQVEVGPWPDKTGWSKKYRMSVLAPMASVHNERNSEKRKLIVFVHTVHLIVRDGCDPKAVHDALMNLEEYQSGLSEDFGVHRRWRATNA